MCAGQKFQAALDVAVLHVHAAGGEQSADAFGIEGEYAGKVFQSLVPIAGLFVQASQIEKHVAVVGSVLGESLVSFDGLRVVLLDAVVGGLNAIFFLRGEILAQVHRFL